MRHCFLQDKVEKMVIGSGGSAFVDGGLGAMIGLGLYNQKDKNITYHNESRSNLKAIFGNLEYNKEFSE